MKRMIRMDTVRNWLAAGLAAMAALLTGCDQPKPPAPDAGPRIVGDKLTFAADSPQLKSLQTARVGAPRRREMQIPGRLVWDEDRTVRVFTPFAGRVTRLIANVGDKVSAGQPLAELLSPDFGQAQADVRKAAADLATKSAQLARLRDLAAAGIAAVKDLQQAEADQQSAEAEYQRATARVSTFGGGRDVDQRFVLKSPIPGVVVEKNLNPGQELRPDQPGSPLFVVTDPTRLWVQLDANEADLAGLKVGTAMLLMTSHYPDDSFAAELRQIADFIDPVTRSMKLRGSVANPDRRLKAEMFVTAKFDLPNADTPSVADKAVLLDGIRRYVFVKTGAGEFTRRGVRVGPASGDAVPVLSGLKEGDEVVVAGALYLQQMLVSAGNRTDPAPAASPAGDGKK